MALIKGKLIEADALDGSKVKLANNQALRARNVGDSADVDIIKLNASDAIEFATKPEVAGGDAVLVASDKGANNGVASLDGSGQLLTAQLPPLAITSTQTVADLAGRLALAGSVQEGDVAVQLDTGITYILTSAGDGSVDGHWQEVLAAGGITSVNGQTGPTVTLTTTDVSEGTNLYYTEGRFDSSLSGKSTTDLSEGTNEYHTTARARAAAVVNSTAGNETDQAASVDAMKTYVTGEIASVQGADAEIQSFTLIAGDITNQYIDLGHEALVDSVSLEFGGLSQLQGSDYTPSYTGGAGSVTRLAFGGDIGTGGDAALVAGDVIQVKYLRA